MEARRDPLAFKVFVAALALALAVTYAVLALTVEGEALSASPIRDAVIFAVLALVAEQMAVWVSERITVTAGNLPILLAIMFCGAVPAMTVAVVVGVWGGWREKSPYLPLFNGANLGLSAAAASLAFAAVDGAVGYSPSGLAPILAAGATAAVVYEVANILMTSVGARLKYGLKLRSFWRSEIVSLLQSLAVLIGLGLAIAAVYYQAGVVSVVLLFAPLFAAQYMFKLLVRERDHVQRQTELSDQYLEMNIGLAAAMVVLLDSKDEYTADHSAAVAMYCRDMAQAVGMSEQEVEEIHVAGLLHDLGKVGTPDAILGKSEALSPDEWQHIRRHPETGAEVLSNLATYRNVADIVRYHHERLDGSGYPEGLRGEGIPEASKILAVADSYHAMTSDRPYRPARSSFEALKELRSVAGVSLDQRYVEALAQVLRDKTLAYRDGSSTDFMDEFRRGRSNLRLREELQVGLSPLAPVQEDPAATRPERRQ